MSEALPIPHRIIPPFPDRRGTGRGLHPAMARAHSRACAGIFIQKFNRFADL